jgi:hypothetical protein
MTIPVLIALSLYTTTPAPAVHQTHHITRSHIGEMNVQDPNQDPCNNLTIQFPQCSVGN